LRRGGVGYYPKTGFMHIDTGPIRYWSWYISHIQGKSNKTMI
jgi:hypothetical protein